MGDSKGWSGIVSEKRDDGLGNKKCNLPRNLAEEIDCTAVGEVPYSAPVNADDPVT